MTETQNPPETPETPEQHSSGAESTGGTGHNHRRSVRTGPIIWGALILAFCGFVLQRTLAPASIEPAMWITATVLGLGALLLAIGIVVAIRGRTGRRSTPTA